MAAFVPDVKENKTEECPAMCDGFLWPIASSVAGSFGGRSLIEARVPLSLQPDRRKG
jgi:hypothetical protein